MEDIQKRPEERAVEFVPLGGADKVRLTVRIIQNLVAVPTRSGKTCSERDALKFIMLCQSQRLNPFLGDCFLVGYDGQNGPEFSLITAHQALLKRAEVHPEYDGMESGVIVKAGEFTKELEGDFHTEDVALVGAWAKVHFKNRKHPSTDRIALRNFIKTTKSGEPTKFWKENPAGQLVKCAEASALRKAFPTTCGGMYLREEISLLGDSMSQLGVPEIFGVPPEPKPPDEVNLDLPPTNKPGTAKPPTAESSSNSPQSALAGLAQENGLTFDAYQRWGEGTGNDDQAGSRGDWSEIPADLCNRYLRSKTGFIHGVKGAK